METLTKFKLNDLYEIGSGISTKPEQSGHGFPFASFSTIFNNPILPDELPDLMDASEKQRIVSSIREGDVFITRTSETLDELAMSSVALKDYPDATFSGFAKRLRPIKQNVAYPKFMAFYFRSPYFRKIINANATMTLRASFNEDIFSYIDLYLPSFDTQKRIGNLFWDIEQKIRINKKINDNLHQFALDTFIHWFAPFQSRPFKPRDGWECVSFGSLSEPTKGRIPDRLSPVIEEGFAPYITIDSASGGDYEYCDAKGMVPCNGETIMVMDGAASGNVYIGPIGCLGSTFSKWVSKRKDVSNSVIYLFLKTYYPYFIKANTGSTVPHANSSFIKDMRVFAPYDCGKFSTFFDKLFKKIEKNNDEIRKLKLLKDRLLPLLINGQATLI